MALWIVMKCNYNLGIIGKNKVGIFENKINILAIGTDNYVDFIGKY